MMADSTSAGTGGTNGADKPGAQPKVCCLISAVVSANASGSAGRCGLRLNRRHKIIRLDRQDAAVAAIQHSFSGVSQQQSFNSTAADRPNHN